MEVLTTQISFRCTIQTEIHVFFFILVCILSHICLLHDNAPAHRALATHKKLDYLGFQCRDHPPYSTDLAPSDYHLFPGLKKAIERSPFFFRRGGHFLRGDLVGRTTF